MTTVRALVPTGYGLNCDYETHYALTAAGAEARRVHINDWIRKGTGPTSTLDHYHILVLGGGFSWADDHGAGVVLASKLRFHLAEEIDRFISQGKLVMGICNGFQTLVNLGLLPGFDGKNGWTRNAAITTNDSGNFIDTWVHLKVNKASPCVFTRGMDAVDLPVRHGEGRFFTAEGNLGRLVENNQVVLQYTDERGEAAAGKWPENPNGSLMDIAGICDPTGRIFGLMPHPEAYNHVTNHPDWTRRKEESLRLGRPFDFWEGEGIGIFKNAVDYIREALGKGHVLDRTPPAG